MYIIFKLLRLLRLTADLSNEPKEYYTWHSTIGKSASPATMQITIARNQPAAGM